MRPRTGGGWGRGAEKNGGKFRAVDTGVRPRSGGRDVKRADGLLREADEPQHRVQLSGAVPQRRRNVAGAGAAQDADGEIAQ